MGLFFLEFFEPYTSSELPRSRELVFTNFHVITFTRLPEIAKSTELLSLLVGHNQATGLVHISYKWSEFWIHREIKVISMNRLVFLQQKQFLSSF